MKSLTSFLFGNVSLYETLQADHYSELYNELELFLSLPPRNRSVGKFMHALDMLRKCVLQPSTHNGENGVTMLHAQTRWVSYRSAVELDEAGISFQKREAAKYGHVSFNRGVLMLPMMAIGEYNDCLFHNLTAFERLNIGVGKEVTMFLLFMCSIINSAKDVSILCQSGILINNYGSYEDIAKLFNSLPKESPMEYYSLGYGVNDFNKMRCEIDDFCMKPWNRWRANLIQTYFRNPLVYDVSCCCHLSFCSYYYSNWLLNWPILSKT